MSELRTALRDYLALRRALGYTLKEETEWLLASFVSYLEEHDESHVTTTLAVAWATQPAGADPRWWHQRLGTVRGFARSLTSIDPRAEVPSADLLPAAYNRVTPYMYSEADITALLRAAGALPGRRSFLRAAQLDRRSLRGRLAPGRGGSQTPMLSGYLCAADSAPVATE